MDNNLLKHGAFSWFELMTTDVPAAKNFYTKLLGWKTQDMPMENMDYTVVKVDDDDVADNAVELGGRVLVEPKDIPNVGRFCVIQDPQGAWFSAISYVKS